MFTKTCFPSFSELCKDTPRTHHTIPWKKRSWETFLLVLTDTNVVTLIRWNYTVFWHYSDEWQLACCFQKSQILDQTCFSNEEQNEPVLFSGRFEAELFTFQRQKNTAFPLVANSLVQKTCFPHFRSFVKTYIWHNVPFHERSYLGRVFCEFWLAYHFLTLVSWNCAIRWLPNKKWQADNLLKVRPNL